MALVTRTKKRTYVRAGGQEIAWQNGDGGGSVVFQATDPAGASIRSAESDGDIFDAQGTESSPAELDPMGGNVATESPFVTQTGGTSCVGCGLLDETMPLWAMGGEPRLTHNGFPISQEEAAMLIDNGLGMPSDLVQHMNHPNFRFQTFGFGMYRAFSVIGYRDVSPEDPEPDGDGPIRVNTAEQRIWGWITRQTEQSGFDAIAMSFDGCTLNVVLADTENGKERLRTFSFPAVSGKKDSRYTNPLLKNGPIPDGEYSFYLSEVQYRFQKNLWGGYDIPSWAKNEKIRGTDTPEADAYGDYRVPLTVEKYDKTPIQNRYGFYLHGSQNGNGFGSNGCIDLGTAEVCNGVVGGLYNYYQEAQHDLKVSVVVKRTCNPFKSSGRR